MSTRKKYLAEMQIRLDRWNKDIDELEKKTQTVSSELKAEYRKQVESLKDKRDEVARKFKELQSASDSAWEELKDGMEQAWKFIDHAVSSTKSKIFGKEKESIK